MRPRGGVCCHVPHPPAGGSGARKRTLTDDLKQIHRYLIVCMLSCDPAGDAFCYSVGTLMHNGGHESQWTGFWY